MMASFRSYGVFVGIIVMLVLVYWSEDAQVVHTFKDKVVDVTGKLQTTSSLLRSNLAENSTEKQSSKTQASDDDSGTTSTGFLAVVALSSTYNDFKNFHTRIFKALDTWMTEPIYYVVFSLDQKESYNQFCVENENKTILEYCKRLHPLFVDCKDGHGNGATNCKEEKGLLELRREVGRFEYVWYADDDIYLRLDYLKEYLKMFPSDDIFTITAGDPINMGFGAASNCTKDEKAFQYPWGTPVCYSKGAMDVLLEGFQYGSLVTIGREFKIMHDVGNAILHWALSLPNNHGLEWVQFDIPNNLVGTEMGIHGVERGRATMEEAHSAYGKLAIPANTMDFPVKWHNVTGIQQTAVYRKYGDPRHWKANEWDQLSVDVCVKE